MDKEKPVIIDIGSNRREFRTTVKATPEKNETDQWGASTYREWAASI